MGLPACSKKDGSAAATQVAAKVGSEEITVYQINQVLQRTNVGNASPEAAQVLSRQVLEKLIDQQLAVDQAMEAKLHRSPDVVAQIEGAKRDILARAYVQQLTSGLPKPSTEDIKAYYSAHPQLFAERRIFNLQEIVLPAQPGMADQLRALATPGRTPEDIAADLKSKGINFNGGAATRAAEQLPLELLSKIHKLNDGQSTIIESPQTITYLRLVSSKSEPVAEATALPRIEQFLANQRATEAIAAKVKQLRAATTITYEGEFAKPATPAAAAAAAAPAAEATVAPAADAAKTAIDKGVAGLK
jgi:EpsD family peptidyl-prolyl cis-trans isomerase